MTEANGHDSLLAFSQNLAKAVERVSPAIVAIDARPRVATSGVVWRDGVIVSTNHTVQRDEESQSNLRTDDGCRRILLDVIQALTSRFFGSKLIRRSVSIQ